MKQQKKFFTLLCSITLLTTVPAYADMSPEEDAEEYFFIEAGLPDISGELIKESCTDLTPFQVVTFLTNPGDAILIQNFLQLQLYKSTAPVVVRSLQDNPNLRSRRIDECDGHNQLSMKLFFMQMRKAFLTPCSPFIESYLAINDPEVTGEIDRLSQALEEAGDLPQAIDIPTILPLFSKIKLEERRIGGMFAYQRRDDWFEWRLQVPLYYFEHNFFLTKQEQAAIADAPLFKDISANQDSSCSGNTVQDFLTEHVVNDFFGIGDLRAQFLADVITTDCFIFSLGAELDLPTTITLARGIIGRNFSECPEQPPFDYFKLMCLAQTNPTAAQNLGMQFGIGALDRLTQIAGLAHLGSQHAGIGLLAEFDYSFDETLRWDNKFRLFYSCPANEKRFFRTIKNPVDFERDYEDLALGEANNLFLSEQTVLFLYPPVVIARTIPGVITQYTTSFFWNRDCFKAELGYDLWYQGPEQLRIVDYLGAPRNLDVCKGIKAAAIQHKIFANIAVDRNDGCYDWRFMFFGDVTFANRGIGKDWTVGVDLRTLF